MTAYIHLHQKPKAASFTQLPNFLFEVPGFQPLSNGAKILYAMLLRRTDLSRKKRVGGRVRQDLPLLPHQ